MTAPVVNPCGVCGSQAHVHSSALGGPACRPCGDRAVLVIREAYQALEAGTIDRREFNRIRRSLLTTPAASEKMRSHRSTNPKESTMARTPRTPKSTPVPAIDKALARVVGSKAKRPAASGKPVPSGTITAATAARDAGLSGPRFRAWLRANDMPRQWATKAQANKAVAAFKKATGK